MTTPVITVDPQHPDPEAIGRAAAILQRGGLVAFPTETVYGLGVHALDKHAVRRLFAAKGRPANDPLIVHLASVEEVGRLAATMPAVAAVLAERFWPGPLTLVLPRSSVVPDEVTAGLDTVAVRIPSHPVALALIAAAGVPLAAPSANLFSRPSPTCAAHVLHDLDGRIDAIVDGGSTSVGVESTVLDLAHGRPVILRPGAVTGAMLRAVIGAVLDPAPDEARPSAHEPLPSPGLLTRHYSPRAPLTLYTGEPSHVVARIESDARAALQRGARVGILAADGDRGRFPAEARVVAIGPADDLQTVAARLYAALREIDAAGVDLILARGFGDDDGIGGAIADRLRRAAAGKIVKVS